MRSPAVTSSRESARRVRASRRLAPISNMRAAPRPVDDVSGEVGAGVEKKKPPEGGFQVEPRGLGPPTCSRELVVICPSVQRLRNSDAESHTFEDTACSARSPF